MGIDGESVFDSKILLNVSRYLVIKGVNATLEYMDTLNLQDINIYDIGNTIQIVGTIWKGPNNICFITQFPDKDEDLSNAKKMIMSLSDWDRFLKQTDILETEIFLQDPSGVTKKIIRKTQRQIDSYMQWNVFQRDNYTCRYCGRTGIPLTVDHIDLWEEGGATVIANLITACRRCNKDRGRMLYEDWLKSPIYQKYSQSLPETVIANNLDIIQQLPVLRGMRVSHIRSR